MNNLYIVIALAIVAGTIFVVVRWSKSRGTIKIVLEKNTSYTKGEIVKEKINVDLKKLIHASDLHLKLMVTNDSEGVYEQIFPVVEEGDFLKGEYPFEIQIPQDLDSASGSLLNINNAPYQTLGWFLRANLKISGSLSISNDIVLDVV